MTSRFALSPLPAWKRFSRGVALALFLFGCGGDDSPTAVNERPTATITSPADGSGFNQGAAILFAANARDDEDGTLNGDDLVWTSSIDGEIGTGTSFSRSNLSGGEHSISLTATDSDGEEVTRDIEIAINRLPIVTIAGPPSGILFPESATVAFAGSAADPEDGSLTGESLIWTSNRDGEIGVGASFTSAPLSGGEHTVVLNATDSDGATGSTQIVVRVNRPAETQITSPSALSTFTEGQTITFTGSALDPEEGALAGAALVWTSSLDGQIGTGTTFTRSDLSAGSQTVTLTANDDDGASASVSIDFTVISANQAPVGAIAAPAAGANFAEGAEIPFSGSATDAEDGTLVGAALVWTSSVDGQLGTGASFTRSNLAEGSRTVTLIATDSDGASDTMSVAISVGPVPLTIGQPITGLSSGIGAQTFFVLTLTETVPATTLLRIRIAGGTGDADMYVRHGSKPTTSTYDCRPYLVTPEEVCEFTTPASGQWYVMLDAFSAFSGITLVAETEAASGCALTDPDGDGDRLPDCAETGTGVFVSELDAGTDAAEPDTDGDGIDDGDETLGTVGGLALPAMGASPLRRDILLEYDWFQDANDCAVHSHRPTAAQVDFVTATFAAAPAGNPDGTQGINFIHDYGQGGEFTGGNLINDADGVIAGGVFDAHYTGYKAANFAANRNGYFHYVLLPHRYETTSGSSGQATIHGDDMIVSIQCLVAHPIVVPHTIVHELGHNLGLRHGGFEELNWKPNYNSVMNYKYQFPGIDNNCTPPGDGILDYSRGVRPNLSEAALNEANGVCGAGGPAWDWNGDLDTADSGLVFDINVDNQGVGDGLLNVLQDYNDWGTILLTGISGVSGLNRAQSPLEIVSCMDTPHSLQD